MAPQGKSSRPGRIRSPAPSATLAPNASFPIVGIGAPDKQAATQWPGFRAPPHPLDIPASPALSMAPAPGASIATRRVAILVGNGVDAAAVQALQPVLAAAGAQCLVVAANLGSVAAADGAQLAVDCSLLTTPSVVFDAVYLPCMGIHAAAMAADGDAVQFVLEAYKHCKAIAASGSGAGLLSDLGISMPTDPGVTQPQPGVVLAPSGALPDGFAEAFIAAISQHRHWERNGLGTIAA